jgi:hypothetical protein
MFVEPLEAELGIKSNTRSELSDVSKAGLHDERMEAINFCDRRQPEQQDTAGRRFGGREPQQ